MKRFLYKIGVFGLIAFLLLNGVAFLSLFFLGNSCLYKPQFLENGVKENRFDYLVLGSSTGLTTLNTKAIDSLTGAVGLNMSIDDSSMGTHFLTLQHFYALKKKTKYVVLAVTPWDAQEINPELSDNDYRFITYAGKEYIHAYYASMENGFFKPLTLTSFSPIFGVSYYNTEVFYPSLMAAVQPQKRNRFDDRGNYTYPQNSVTLPETAIINVNVALRNPFFSKIQQLCSSNKSKLIVYISPLYQQKVQVLDNRITLINHGNLLTDSKQFYDAIHVNHLGRAKASAHFAAAFLPLYQNIK